MPGALDGIRVIEIAAIGPVPFCGMLLSDMGAEVIRVDRTSGAGSLAGLADVCSRGKKSVGIDLKNPEGRDLFLRVAASADVVLEGFRPGVVERLGIGPGDVAAANPGVIFGRMTGWGQTGPMAHTAGHDINYIGLVGALHAIGDEAPVVPLNLIGDYGGGALYLALGVLAALHERQTSGLGQVIDAAMIDGAASLMTPTYQLASAGLWTDRRNSNILDGSAPFYRVYETADGGYMAVGALEPQFYAVLLERLGIAATDLPAQYDRSGWPQACDMIAAVFRSENRHHWEEVFAGSDGCATPVLGLVEAPDNVHNQARTTFMNGSTGIEPSPAPRFSRTPSAAGGAAPRPRQDTADVLTGLGVEAAEVARLLESGVIAGETQ